MYCNYRVGILFWYMYYQIIYRLQIHCFRLGFSDFRFSKTLRLPVPIHLRLNDNGLLLD